MNEINELFQEMKNIKKCPDTMEMVNGKVKKISFFPGGKGTFDKSDKIPLEKYMIVGQDWGCLDGYNKALTKTDEEGLKEPT